MKGIGKRPIRLKVLDKKETIGEGRHLLLNEFVEINLSYFIFFTKVFNNFTIIIMKSLSYLNVFEQKIF